MHASSWGLLAARISGRSGYMIIVSTFIVADPFIIITALPVVTGLGDFYSWTQRH